MSFGLQRGSALEEESGLRELDDERLAEVGAYWRQQFVVANRFPGSSNSLFARKARMIRAVEAEQARRSGQDAQDQPNASS